MHPNFNINNSIKKWDKNNMYASLQNFYLQCQQTLADESNIKIPVQYKKIKNILIAGMGGSTLGSHIIKSVFEKEIKIPFQIINNYTLPGSLTKDTLVVVSSYSGNTEETLSAFYQAKTTGAKIWILTAGGKLKKLKEKHNIPGYIFNPCHNPCQEPRMGLGYFIFALLILLQKNGLIKIKKEKLKKITQELKKWSKQFSPENKNNFALKTAKKIRKKIPIVIGSEFLLGNAHILRNQFNENSKTFSCWMEIPEINHHLMEGLAYPKSNSKELIFIFLNSRLYHPRIKKRYPITQKIIQKNKIDFIEFCPSSPDKLSQSFEILAFGGFLSFYLAILNRLNPTPTQYVAYLKKELKK